MENWKYSRNLHDVELEKFTLCDALLDKNARLKVVTELRKDDFYTATLRPVFTALQDMTMHGENFDSVLLVQKLKNNGTFDAIGGVPALTQLFNMEPTAANVKSHIAKLKLLAARRDTVDTLNELLSQVIDLGTSDERIIELNASIRAAAGKPVEPIQREHMKDSREVYLDVFAEISEQKENPNNAQNGVKTGLRDIDTCIGSLKPSELYVIGGRPSEGKSTLALTIAINAALEDKKVLYCGLEMSNNETYKRVIARMSNINGTHLFNPQRLTNEEWQAITTGGDKIASLPIVFDDSTTLSPLDVKRKAKEFKQKTGNTPDLIVIDYLGLMSAGMRKENRNQELSYITRTLKNFAGELNCPILLLSQLNRDKDHESRAPRLSDLRDSGTIEENANGVILISRDKSVVSSPNGERVPKELSTSTLYLAKWRNAPKDNIQVFFDAKHYCFKNLSKRDSVSRPLNRKETKVVNDITRLQEQGTQPQKRR